MTALDFASLFSADARAFVPSAIRALAPLINDPTVISFAAGVPNPETFPVEALAESAARVLRTIPMRALQYDVTRGYLPLRERVAERSARKGIPLSIKDAMNATLRASRSNFATQSVAPVRFAWAIAAASWGRLATRLPLSTSRYSAITTAPQSATCLATASRWASSPRPD